MESPRLARKSMCPASVLQDTVSSTWIPKTTTCNVHVCVYMDKTMNCKMFICELQVVDLETARPQVSLWFHCYLELQVLCLWCIRLSQKLPQTLRDLNLYFFLMQNLNIYIADVCRIAVTSISNNYLPVCLWKVGFFSTSLGSKMLFTNNPKVCSWNITCKHVN